MKIKNPEELTDTLHRYMDEPKYKDIAIDLVSINNIIWNVYMYILKLTKCPCLGHTRIPY